MESNPEKSPFSLLQSKSNENLMNVCSQENFFRDEDAEDKPNLLIANDNYFLLNAFEEMSRSLFKVFKADNGLEAYEIAISKPIHFFDAIILDLDMPILDGFQAGAKIRNYINSNILASLVGFKDTPLSRSIDKEDSSKSGS